MPKLEYQDGLGDLLREREKQTFSWAKTATITLIIGLVVLLSLALVAKVGKWIYERSNRSDIPPSVMKKMEKMEHELELTSAASPTISATSGPVKKVSVPTAVSPASIRVEPNKVAHHEQQPKQKMVEKKEVVEKKVVERKTEKPHSVVKHVAEKPPVAAKPKPKESKPSEPKPVVSVVDGVPFKVIAGKFASQSEALASKKQCDSKGVPTYIWVSQTGKTPEYVVQVGAFSEDAQAKQWVQTLARKGIASSVIRK